MPISSFPPFAYEIFKGIQIKDTFSLAKGITLLESKDKNKKIIGAAILNQLKALNPSLSRKVAFTGPPGAGKSTLIEAIGLTLLSHGLTLAVLTIDPSSPLHGGAILADKTRMQKLSNAEGAFIRPSASGKGYLGGITATTLDVLDLVEAAGYDFILVETIGVGQNEVDIKDLVDQLILVLAPAAGDELQGIKKGITEVVDLIIVNKCDGVFKQSAELTARQYQAAMSGSFNHSNDVKLCSAIENTGIAEVCHLITNYPINILDRRRKLAHLLDKIASQELLHLFLTDPLIQQLMNQQKLSLLEGQTSLNESIDLIMAHLKSCLQANNNKKK